ASTVKVPTMHRLGSYQVATRAGYRAIRLPYSVEALSMVVVLPDEIGGGEKLARDLGAPALAALFRDLTEWKTVSLALPRFKTSFKAKLGELFQAAGMRRAFDLRQADFSGMTSRPPREAPLAISEVVHRAVIDVTEEGTEAAAATAVGMMTASAGPAAEPFMVDRPFLFYIADDATGAILFQGRISDPRQQPYALGARACRAGRSGRRDRQGRRCRSTPCQFRRPLRRAPFRAGRRVRSRASAPP